MFGEDLLHVIAREPCYHRYHINATIRADGTIVSDDDVIATIATSTLHRLHQSANVNSVREKTDSL